MAKPRDQLNLFDQPAEPEGRPASPQPPSAPADVPAAAPARAGAAAAVTAVTAADLPDAEARAYATDPRRNVVLEASAGTGKTSVLVARYLNLLSLGVDPSNILAITFTRKAAAEMRERIVTALRRASTESPEGRVQWMALRDRLNDVAISTIDAFCYGLLREFPLEAGLDPAFTLADETEVARLVEEALDHAIRVCQAIAREDADVALVFARLTAPRLRAGLAHLLERRLVAQGALVRYIRRGPRRMTIEAASARAADRMRAALAGLALSASVGAGRDSDAAAADWGRAGWSEPVSNVAGMHVEAFIADGPGRHPRFRLLASDLRALARGDAMEPARLAAVFDEIRAYFLTRSGEPRTRLTGVTADQAASRAAWKRHVEAVRAIAPGVRQALDAWGRDLNVVLARGVQRMFAIALREYRRTLAEHEVLDFAEVLGRAVDLLRQMDEFSQSRYRLESRYHHVLVDEFQDTSRMQWQLVSLLVASWGEGFGLVHEAPLPPSLFVVGDRKQSIYRFRDADVSLLDDAAYAIEGLRPDGPVRRVIARSFRSVPAILAFVNDLCGQLPEGSSRGDAFRYDERDRFPLEGIADPFAHLSAARNASPPDVDSSAEATSGVLGGGGDDTAWGRRLRPAPLGVIVDETIEACAVSVAGEIVRLLGEGIVRDRDTGVAREARPGDIAILFRSRDSHREFEEALEARRIPSYVYKGLGFFDADEIKDLSALMRYFAAPESNLRAAAFLRSRFVRVSDAALRDLGIHVAALLRAPEEASTWRDAAGRLADEDRRVLERLRASLPAWLALVDRLPPAELIDHVLATSAYGGEIEGVRAHQARENVKKMRALVRRIQNRGYATLGRIAEHLDRLSAGDEANATIEALDAVSLMTVHASKGLEFPIVFLVNVARGVAARRQPIRVLVQAADPTSDLRASDGDGDGDGESDEAGRDEALAAEAGDDPADPAALDAAATFGAGQQAEVAVETFISEADTLEPAKEREETKRLLYVALTRARDTLYLSTLLKEGQFKPTPGSLGSVMPASMTVMFEAAARTAHGAPVRWSVPGSGNAHELLVVSHSTAPDDDAASHTSSTPDTSSSSTTSEGAQEASRDERHTETREEWTRVQVTQMIGKRAETGAAGAAEAAGVAGAVAAHDRDRVERGGTDGTERIEHAEHAEHADRAERAERAAHALVGRLVHRLFQARADAETLIVRLASHARRLMRAEEALGLEEPDAIAARAAAVFQRVAARAEVRALLADGRCLYEVPFSLRVATPASGHLIVRGTIDALVQRSDGTLVVVEFKTGARRVDHDEQLAVYVDAARALFPDCEVSGRLIYP